MVNSGRGTPLVLPIQGSLRHIQVSPVLAHSNPCLSNLWVAIQGSSSGQTAARAQSGWYSSDILKDY